MGNAGYLETADAERTRTIRVSAVDSAGGPVGAVVNVSVFGVKLGSLQLSEDGAEGLIELPDQFHTVQLNARLQDQILSTLVEHGETAHQFIFSGLHLRTIVAPLAQARCPDGTTGTPCVICTVSGIKVRLCV
jgi:hypothetical protein